MIKAIILDDGYHSNDVVIKFGENYKSVSLVYFLNLLCKLTLSSSISTRNHRILKIDLILYMSREMNRKTFLG
jgi:hypothetical protein